MVVVFTHGKMDENMRVNINLTKNMVSVPTLGKMEGSMLDSGRIVNVMVRER